MARRRSLRSFLHLRKRHNPKRKISHKIGSRHRPVIVHTRTGWSKSPKSTLFGAGPVRLNPRRRRRGARRRFFGNPVMVRYHRKRHARRNPIRSYRRHYRRNPGFGKMIPSKKLLIQAAMIGGGVAAGMFTLPLVYGVLPASLKTANTNKWIGALNVLLGGLMVGFIRNKSVKEIGLVIAGVGVYDLIAENIPQLGLPIVPKTNILIAGMVPGSAATVTPAAVQGASYGVPTLPVSHLLSASYDSPGSVTAGLSSDSPYEGLEF